MSEVRGSGLECQALTLQERPRGATLCPRSEAAAERNYPASEVRGGWEKPSGTQGQGQQLRGGTSRPRLGAVTLRSHPEPEARAGGWEEFPRSCCCAGTGGHRGAIPC